MAATLQRQRWKTWLNIVAVNVILLSAALIGLEGFCRWRGIPYSAEWTPTENSLAQFDRELGWAYLPNLSKTVNENGHQWPVFTNQDGIRVAAPGTAFDAALPSILFIGCSFTMGHGLPYEESFVGQFAALPEMPLQVVNLGVQAYGTDQAWLALKKFLPKFHARIVVYTFIAEHILRNGNYDRRLLFPTANFLGTKPLFAMNGTRELYLAKPALRYKEYRCSYLWDALQMKVGTRLGWFPPFPKELTQQLMLAMKQTSEAAGAKFVVLNWRWTPEEYREIFDGLDLRVLDTLTNAPPGWSQMRMWQNGGHPTAAASAHAAQLLYDDFRRNHDF